MPSADMEFGLENARLDHRLNRHQRRSSLTTVEVEPIVIKRWASANSNVFFCDWSGSTSPVSSSSHSSLSAFGQKSKSAFQLRNTSMLVAPLALDEDEVDGISRQQQQRNNIIIAITSAEDEPDHLTELTDEEDCSTPSRPRPTPRCGSKRPTNSSKYFLFFSFLCFIRYSPLTFYHPLDLG
jgi:hypothetical protein